MLLMSPISKQGVRDDSRNRVAARCSRWVIIGGLLALRVHRIERLIEIADDVVDVLDADAEPDHLWRDACVALLIRRHLSVCGRRGMTRERFGVAQVDEPLDQT